MYGCEACTPFAISLRIKQNKKKEEVKSPQIGCVYPEPILPQDFHLYESIPFLIA